MKTGVAHLPLHGGKAPAWLFKRMTKLAAEISYILIKEYGTQEFLRRLPFDLLIGELQLDSRRRRAAQVP